MKKNWLLIGGVVLLVVVAVLMVSSASKRANPVDGDSRPPRVNPSPAHDHSATTSGAKTVPAYLQVAPSKSSLAPTLEPEKFTGPTRELIAP